ncbi:hypothetical protein K8Q98_01975 [Candidatus Nomurabacteria bacterium]|nr:hypothetical protein [Candidatus Nomurabacteria bacterium]
MLFSIDITQFLFNLAMTFFGLSIITVIWNKVVKNKLIKFTQKRGLNSKKIKKNLEESEHVVKGFYTTGRVLAFLAPFVASLGGISGLFFYLVAVPFFVGSFLFGLFFLIFEKISGFAIGQWWSVVGSEQKIILAAVLLLCSIVISVLLTHIRWWHFSKKMILEYPFVAVAISGTLLGLIWRIWSVSGADLIWGLVVIIVGIKVISEVTREILRKHWGADLVAAAALIGAIWQGELLAGSIIALMTASGEALENYGFKRATKTLQKMLEYSPKIARLLNEQMDIVIIKAEDVKEGNRLQINAGDIIPVDCVILAGTSDIDFSPVNGEPLPQTCTVGALLQSGSINLSGGILVEAKTPAEFIFWFIRLCFGSIGCGYSLSIVNSCSNCSFDRYESSC